MLCICIHYLNYNWLQHISKLTSILLISGERLHNYHAKKIRHICISPKILFIATFQGLQALFEKLQSYLSSYLVMHTKQGSTFCQKYFILIIHN